MKRTILRSLFFFALFFASIVASFFSGFTTWRVIPHVVSKPATALRILPLGDSITYGIGNKGNSYRPMLLEHLTPLHTVEYVGSRHSGDLANDAHEGHVGYRITRVGDGAKLSLWQRPNLILLLAGTNDVLLNITKDAPERLNNLINQCLETCPDATILVGTLPPIAKIAWMQVAIDIYNTELLDLIERRAAEGVKTALVDFAAHLTLQDLSDGIHPQNVGYTKMASLWYAGIQEAFKKGWIHDPVPSEGLSPPEGLKV